MKISLLAFLRFGCVDGTYQCYGTLRCKIMLHGSNEVSYWTGTKCNKKLAFRHDEPGAHDSYSSGRSNTTVMFVNGLLSSMNGTKCRALQRYCKKNCVSFLCFDYRGHGQSSGQFIDCTMHDWIADASDMLDYIVSLGEEQNQESNVILIGSSLGAWISLVLAMQKPDAISAVIGIGSAIDYTSDTYDKLLSNEQRAIWKNSMETSSSSNHFRISSPYLDDGFPFSRDLYISGNDYLICQDSLRSKGIMNCELKCPVRFLHGDEDDVVPYAKIYDAASALRSKYYGKDITMKLLQAGDHRLSTADDVTAILDTLDELLRKM